MLKNFLLSTMLCAAATVATAAEPVELTFNRTGTDAGSVTVTATGLPGVTATLTEASPAFKPTASSVTSSILCPNANANTNPTITLEFTVNGLPADYQISGLGLDIHALDGTSGYQAADDGKTRQWNVAATVGGTQINPLSNIDIAAGVNASSSMRHKVWTMEAASPVTATSPLVIRLTITKGSENPGCFFGLSSLKLLTDGEGGGTVEPKPDPEPTPEPTPIDPSEGSYWYIKWKANTSDYIRQSGTKFIIGEKSTTASCLWEFVPTDKENCYYLRNVTTGQYMGSCNMTPASASKVLASDTPVEYYVGKTASTNSEIKGCYWLSSTDCSGYNVENNTRCLNKDGASDDIITWKNNTAYQTNVGSYWTLEPYEDRPFTPAQAIGEATYFYYIQDADGKALNHDLQWVERGMDASQKWYFVGEANAMGGYQVVAADATTASFEALRFVVAKAEDGLLYTLTDANGNKLSIAGVDAFTFSGFRDRNPFALKAQIYTLPCGSLGSNYVTSVAIDANKEGFGDYRYPMATENNGSIEYPMAGTPSHRYTMLSRDRANIGAGEFEVNITLKSAPASNELVLLYFDWDRDGVFEKTVNVTPAKEMNVKVEVPETAKAGESRMRIKVTSNGLVEADDDVAGQVLDLFLNYVPAGGKKLDPIVRVNSRERGSAYYNTNSHYAVANKYGTAAFLFWRENNRVYSVEPSCEVAPSEVQRVLTAVFSPNLDLSGIDTTKLGLTDGDASINVHGHVISVLSSTAVSDIMVFGIDGSLLLHTCGASEADASHLASGVYVVKALTANGSATAKIIL
ncbi:MAG: T9SS type A sorting domain-containing protein [Firmicutes bacterium]|nr:T9SS type A sorting domain-containing protein [Bacillota bacterium]MCM1401348.1 T9SS type A sorting domain-containing protein [Bacteroides sp.]MCM1477301.1 T9SS type A sorting domain-containing protein [Bacteroides sp.]